MKSVNGESLLSGRVAGFLYGVKLIAEQRAGFVVEFVAGIARAGADGIATLGHESADDAMEGGGNVVSLMRENHQSPAVRVSGAFEAMTRARVTVEALIRRLALASLIWLYGRVYYSRHPCI